jgi:hypothetical protein
LGPTEMRFVPSVRHLTHTYRSGKPCTNRKIRAGTTRKGVNADVRPSGGPKRGGGLVKLLAL